MLISFTISQESLDAFAKKFGDDKKAKVKTALGEIKREWQTEFVRQDKRMQSVWTPLKGYVTSKTGQQQPKSRSYLARKTREYYSHKARAGSGPVRYLRILKRTGTMLDKYINGIHIDDVNVTVSIPFPSGAEGVRARSHQGITPLPFGVLSTRKYDLSRFKDVAEREIKRAMSVD